MRPTLFSLPIGDHTAGLHTYGVLVALGFALGIVLFWREGQRQGFDGGRLLDLSFWSIVAGLTGSRLTFVVLNARDFADACFRGASLDGRLAGCAAALRFWDGGFVFYGGVVAVAGVVAVYCRRERWSFWRLGDLAAPTLAIGHALGRLGCFFAGCCFGKLCHAPWAVAFPAGSAAYQDLGSVGVIAPGAVVTPPLHPTQLYESAGELLIFLLLLGLRRAWRRRDTASGTGPLEAPSRAPGGLLLTYAACYGALRFVVELFRGDVTRRFVVEWTAPALAERLGLDPDQPLFLSVSQLVSSTILVAAAAAFMWRRRRPRRRADELFD